MYNRLAMKVRTMITGLAVGFKRAMRPAAAAASKPIIVVAMVALSSLVRLVVHAEYSTKRNESMMIKWT